jgi:hypothetical protein
MSNKVTRKLFPGLSALFVASLFLFSALWVNGNFSLPLALSIAIVLAAGTYLAMAKGAVRRAR